MKKWSILVIVVLAAVLLAMQYLMEKKRGSAPPAGPQPGQSEQLGVTLPAGATSYELPVSDNYVPESAGGASYGSSIYLPFIQSAYKGACEGGSLKDMLSTHGSYWGFFARGVAFNMEETSRMYELLSDYVACNASARTDVSLCDSLPGAAQGGGVTVTDESSPNYSCRKKTVLLLFEAYLAGAIKGDSYCRLQMSYWPREDVDRVSVPDYCAAAAGGPEGALAYVRKVFTDVSPSDLAGNFPSSRGDCGGDKACLEKLALYQAVKGNNYSGCPRNYAPECRALLERSTAPCDKLLQDMSKFYCGAAARVRKISGGFIGLTQDEFKGELEKAKAAKAQEAALLKEMKKLDEEVNKRAREMLNKK